MKRIALLLFVKILLSQTLAGKLSDTFEGGKIIGKVVDKSNGLPLEFATISIFTADSVLVTGGLVAANGLFTIAVKQGKYYAEVQFISYEKETIPGIVISSDNKVFKTGTIKLSPELTSLDEVTVSAEKSEMIIHLDKKIFNVGKDLSNTGKSALDILDNIPSVTVDLDGNVSLRGSQNLQILVDGKPSGLVNAGNTDALRNIQGTLMERVEIITNPSARYEAEGMAGIINIILKKEQQKGVNGSFEVTAGYPHQYSLGANVNFRREKINYFLNYSIRYNERPGAGYSYQNFTLADTSYITEIDRNRLRTGMSNRLRGGADFLINTKNSITAAFLLGYSDEFNTSNISYQDYTISHELISRTHRLDEEEEDEFNIEFSINYEKKFDKEEHKFIAIFQYLEETETEKSKIGETISPIAGEIIEDEFISQRSLNEENVKNLLFQADYMYPFGNKGQFETGYRSELRHITNPYIVEEKDEVEDWNKLPEYSNNFDYIENIHALYIQAGNNFNKTSIQLGLRTELSDVATHLRETDESNKSIYVDFFPTLHTTYQFNEINSMQISYSRRIHRPHFWLLNPFYSYTDSRNIRTGNPNVKPEYTHSLEAGYLMNRPKLNFYSGIYYRYTSGVIERISVIDDSTGITYIIPSNLSERQSFGLETNMSINPVKWWTLSGDLNFFRSITDGEYEGEKLNSDDYSWNTRLNSKMRFPESIDFQTIFFYRGPKETTQGRRDAFYMLNMALSKDIFKGRGTLTFNVRDVLNSRQYRFTIDQPDLYSVNKFRRSERSYTLTFIYRLNQKKRMGRNGGSNGEDPGGDDMGF